MCVSIKTKVEKGMLIISHYNGIILSFRMRITKDIPQLYFLKPLLHGTESKVKKK